MKNNKFVLWAVGVIAGIFLPSLCLAATVMLQFDSNGNATTTPGSSLVLTGNLNTASSTAPVYFNSLSGLFLTSVNNSAPTTTDTTFADSAGSFAYLPASLNPGQQYQGPLVRFVTATNTTPGDYWGKYNLLGGDAASSTTTLASQFFYVHVVATSTQATSTPPASTSTNFSNFVGLQFPGGSNNGAGANGLQMQGYASGPRLIQLNGSSVVYWVSPGNIKIPMWTDVVFKSYNNNTADVQTVGQAEFDSYQTAQYIRLKGNARIYKTESQVKRFIPSSVWNSLGWDGSNVIDVNKPDFDSYKTGKTIVGIGELVNL